MLPSTCSDEYLSFPLSEVLPVPLLDAADLRASQSSVTPVYLYVSSASVTLLKSLFLGADGWTY